MKVWALVGFFTILAAPSAFAETSLADTPINLRDVLRAQVDPIDPADRDRMLRPAKRDAPKMPTRAEREAAAAAAREEAERRERERALRRRNGRLDGVPDSVLIGSHRAL